MSDHQIGLLIIAALLAAFFWIERRLRLSTPKPAEPPTPAEIHRMAADHAREMASAADSRVELFMHAKTGGVYAVMCYVVCEATGENMVVYRNVRTGERWVRPSSEFYDPDRFVEVSP